LTRIFCVLVLIFFDIFYVNFIFFVLFLKANAINQESFTQNKINSFYNKTFNQNNNYNPFPSLNKTYENSNNLATRPPLPPRIDHYSDFNLISNQNPNRLNSLISNTNKYDPFPSLAKLQTSPELFTNQAYQSSKFRKTKLW
jgi:hypothetical protein